jgi:heptaprenyl diphosphate synthase
MKNRLSSGPTLRRRAFFSAQITSGTLFLAGFLAMPAFLINGSLLSKTLQFFLLWLFVWVVGKRNSLWMTLSISMGIVLFNLMIPYGRLLWHWGPFEITQGALLGGIQKAITVEGLVLLSKTFIRSDLELPGTFGRRIGESFRIFELMMEGDDRFEWKNPISSLDRILIKFSQEALQKGITTDNPTRKKTTAWGYMALGIAVGSLWGTLLWQPVM